MLDSEGAKVLIAEGIGEDAGTKPAAAIEAPQWREFAPQRADAHHVGTVGDQLFEVLELRSGVRDVYVTQSVVDHYWQHEDQFDVGQAEAQLSRVVADPLYVYQGKKRRRLFLWRFLMTGITC
jgi:hypothetical protein